MVGQVLELRGTQALVAGVVLAVEPAHAVHGKFLRERLHGGGIDALIAVEGFFDMNLQRVAAALRHGDGEEPAVQLHAADEEVRAAGHAEHFLGAAQLVFRRVGRLGEDGLVVAEELRDERQVALPERAEGGVGIELAELVDVVALSGVAASGKVAQILGGVDIVAPDARGGKAEVGVARGKALRLVLRDDGEDEGNIPLAAVVLDERERRVLIAVGAGNGVVEAILTVDEIADDQAARALRPRGVQVAAPHELDEGRVFAELIFAAFIVAAQAGNVPLRDRSKGEHRVFLFFRVVFSAPAGRRASLL